MGTADVLCLFGHVLNQIIFHHVDLIGDGKILSAAPDYQNGGNAVRPEKLVDPVGKRRDGLFFNQFLHHAVTDHKVGRAPVLVDEQQPGAAVDRFHDIGCL